MRDFLLKMYYYLKRLPAEKGLHAAAAVALAMLGEEDRMAGSDGLLSGCIRPEELPCSLLDEKMNPALALGAAMALQTIADGCVVIAPVDAVRAREEDFPSLLQLADSMNLPVVFLMEYDEEFAEDLEAQAALGDIERIQVDSQDAMRLMPVIRLGIDKAREGDGPTLIECVCSDAAERGADTPAARLADVLISEGFATPEELL